MQAIFREQGPFLQMKGKMKKLKYILVFILALGLALLFSWRFSELQRGPVYVDAATALLEMRLLPYLSAGDYDNLNQFLAEGGIRRFDGDFGAYFAVFPNWGSHLSSTLLSAELAERRFFHLTDPVVVSFVLDSNFEHVSARTSLDLRLHGDKWLIHDFLVAPAGRGARGR